MKTKMNGKTLLLSGMLVGVMMVGGATTAFAASTTDAVATTATYSYQVGQQKNEDRHAQYSVIASFTTDAERKAYFEEQGIGGGGKYSTAQHLDAEALVEAGIIDQSTADAIAAFGSQKHDGIHARYESKAGMTASERQAFYESINDDGFAGDSVSELVNANVIAQAQADAINAYLTANSAE